MNRTTRRGAFAALAATAATGVLATSSAARPIVTRWHQLAARADRLVRYRVWTSGRAPSRRQLERELRELTELVADLAHALVDEHTTTEPGVH